MKTVAIILAHGFEEIEAVFPWDLLNRGGIRVISVGLDSLMVQGAHGITMECECLLEELPEDLEGIILPGGSPGSRNLAESEKVISLVRSYHNDGRLVAAICGAPALVLGKSGILAGRKFTCYPGMEKEVSQGIHSEEIVVRDGNIITSRALGTAGEFGLALVEYLGNREIAEKLRKGGLI